MSGNACYSTPAFNKKIRCHLNTESQVWFQSRKCPMQFGVCTRLHTVASMSHESAPDCEQNCLQETFCLSCCPPQPSFPIPVFLLSSVPFFIPLLPFFILFIMLCHPFLSSHFSLGTHGLALWCNLTLKQFVLCFEFDFTYLSVFYLPIKSYILVFLSDALLCVLFLLCLFNQVFSFLSPFPVPALVVQWGPLSWLTTIEYQHSRREGHRNEPSTRCSCTTLKVHNLNCCGGIHPQKSVPLPCMESDFSLLVKLVNFQQKPDR